MESRERKIRRFVGIARGISGIESRGQTRGGNARGIAGRVESESRKIVVWNQVREILLSSLRGSGNATTKQSTPLLSLRESRSDSWQSKGRDSKQLLNQ